ncbi:MAG: hypothetical protein ABJB02_08560 [Dokdonella sp.]
MYFPLKKFDGANELGCKDKRRGVALTVTRPLATSVGEHDLGH